MFQNLTGLTLTTDLDGNPRVVDGTGKGTPVTDIGAYEYQNMLFGTTALTCNPLSLNVGGTSVLTAYSTAGAVPATGALALTDNGVALAQLPLTNGIALYTYTGLTAGPHTLTVRLIVTSGYAGNSATCNLNVLGLPTTSTLNVTPSQTTFGSPLTLSATVQPAQSGAGIPSGTVSFLNGSTVVATASLNNAGIASTTLPNLNGGNSSLTCAYLGDTRFAPSSCNTLPVTITPAPTTLTVTSSANPALASSQPQLTATLTAPGAPIPAGLPVLLNLGNGLGPLTATTDSTGRATFTPLTRPPGTYTFTATFAGNTNYQPSSTTLTQVYTGIQTATAISSSPNPAYQGQTVTVTASVAASVFQLLSGPVTLYDGASALATAQLSSAGRAVFSLNTLSVGDHTLSVQFAGQDALLPSASPALLQTILPSTFAIALTPSTLSLTSGQGAATVVQLTSIGNFAGPLTLSATANPAHAALSFAPATVPLTAGSQASSTLRLSTAELPLAALPNGSSRTPWTVLATAGLLPFALRRRRRFRPLLLLACSAFTLATVQLLSGCGAPVGVPFQLVAPGTYSIPVTATDTAGNQHSTTLTLLVTPR